MSGIQSLGIGSGLLTTDLVDQLVKAERAPTELRLDRTEKRVEAQISAYGSLKSALDTLAASTGRLANAQGIQRVTSKSSNESALTATTNSLAEEGNYSINIQQTAQAHSLASKRYDAPTSTLGIGKVTISFGEIQYDADGKPASFSQNEKKTPFELDVTTENNSLGGIRDAINRANQGVRASLVNDGQGYRLLLTSSETGKTSAMQIDVIGDPGLQSLTYSPLGNDPDMHMSQTQRGQDAELTVNGLAITSKKNTLDEVIRGVTLNLNQQGTGPVNLSLERDVGGVVTQVEEFVEAYNEYRELYQSLVRFDPGSEVGGLLMGDANLRTINNQVRSMLGSIVEGLEDSRYRTLADIGIITDRNNNFNLKLDNNRLEAALRNNASNVAGLLSTNLTATGANVTVVTRTPDTKPGSYEVEITQAAKQATFAGLSTAKLDFSSPVVIDGANSGFRINVDGRTANVDLRQGSYDSGEELALMIQNAINQSFTSGPSVSVGFDDLNQRFEITSSRFGSASEVSILSTSPSVGNTLGLVPPGVGEAKSNTLSYLSDSSFGATTSPGSFEVQPSQGINFANSPLTFDLSLTQADELPPLVTTRTIELNQNMASILDVNGQVVQERDRDDVLEYIQSELNAVGLGAEVKASFTSGNRLIFTALPAAGSQTLEISNLSFSGSDFLGLQEQSVVSGITLSPDTRFELEIANRLTNGQSGAITVPAGVYQTAEELALAMQTAINDEPGIQALASGAKTTMGTRIIGTSNIDFGTRPASIQFNYNGQDYDVLIDQQLASTQESIQAAINAAVGTDVNGDSIINAIVTPGAGLQLATAATGSSEQLTILGSGLGATTAAGSIDLTAPGIDFETDPASFSLRVDGIEINVNVDGDATGSSNLEVIQQSLDRALLQAGGGGRFIAGDVVAKLNDDGQLYFETQSRMGKQTATTFGAGASIELTAADANSQALLGIDAGAASTNGQDGFGLSSGYFQGFSAEATVGYEQDEQGNGQFTTRFDNETSVFIKNPSITALTQLGMFATTESSFGPARGLDVQGTINGVKAVGRGQFLTAAAGNSAATNGYVLGSGGWNFSSGPVTIDPSNRTFELEVDGVASGPVSIANGVYANGASLAQAVQTAINNNSALANASKAVNVQFDTNTGVFGIFSTSRGSDSQVKVTGIGPGASDVLGLTTTTASVRGKNASGQIDPAAGLMLRIDGNQIGKRGSVNYIRGIADELSSVLDRMLKGDGLLAQRSKSLEKEQEQTVEQRSALETRMEVFRARLASQFSFNDRIISRLKTTEDFLVQQFDIMAASFGNRK